ncbi:hypothetical protein ANCCAN_26718 [Ancylostoma caninum]|uniref:Uncharacterized protein n=1 Tax=Ancylostoma caninum TaxID=29170 RepID=A0A368FBJ5_ANCCA|nr:hypothetical protein ANCCAN_26718 [Ancylostoma caninum]
MHPWSRCGCPLSGRVRPDEALLIRGTAMWPVALRRARPVLHFAHLSSDECLPK